LYYAIVVVVLALLNQGNLIHVTIYKTIILPVVLNGCETWPLAVKEEHRLRVVGNRALSRIFGPKSDEVRGEWRKLHKE
jgi:hypothetical protein